MALLDIEKLKELAKDQWELVFDALEIDLERASIDEYQVRMPCPVHGGNNHSAFCYYIDYGIWKCYTRNCEDQYGKDLIGLVMSIKEIEFIPAAQFLQKVLGLSDSDLESQAETIRFFKEINETKREIKDVEIFKQDISPISIENIKKYIQYDEEFFPKLGFTRQTIEKFNIGVCNIRGKPMSNRAFAPILDETGQFAIGFSGRTLLPECPICCKNHHKSVLCHGDGGPPPIAKWFHWGCYTSTLFYNYAYAKPEVEKTGMVIIVEGPKEVWWLDQCGIKNVVAVLGSSIQPAHTRLLIEMSANTVVTCFDKDEAGEKAQKKAQRLFGPYVNIVNLGEVLIDGVDLDEMTPEQINQLFQPIRK